MLKLATTFSREQFIKLIVGDLVTFEFEENGIVVAEVKVARPDMTFGVMEEIVKEARNEKFGV